MRCERAALALGLLLALPTAAWPADPADFLAGRVKDCPKCELAGANLKRFELSGVDLAGANLAGWNRAELERTAESRAHG